MRGTVGSSSGCCFANELCSALQSTPSLNMLRDAVGTGKQLFRQSRVAGRPQVALAGLHGSHSAFPFCSGASWFLQSRVMALLEPECWLPLRPSGSLSPCWPKPEMGFEEAPGTWGGRTFLLE